MSEAKTVEAWASAKKVEHWEVAGLVVHQKWDREPGKLVTEKELDAALAAFRGISVGAVHVEPKPADEPKPSESQKKKGEVG